MIPSNHSVYLLHIYATPKSHQDKIEGWIINREKYLLHVRITAPPEEGKANKAIIRLLAKTLGIAKSHIFLISGSTSRQKVFKIEPWSSRLAKELPKQPKLFTIV